jgi:hypothetical protein
VLLESVFELQEKLLRSAGPGPGLTAQSARDSVAAGRASNLAPVQPEIALGAAPVGGNDFKLAVRLQRRSLVGSARVDAIVEAARGEVDLRYIGRVEKLPAQRDVRGRHRPLAAGTSIGHAAITAGTLGAFVTTADGRLAVLSNNHVLADENRAEIGDPIIQPARFDAGVEPDDVVAQLAEYVPLAPIGPNRVDAAIATLHAETEVDPVGLVGVLGNNIVPPEEADRVQKLGRTTGLTSGRVTAFNVRNVIVEYETSPTMRFDGQIEIQTGDRSAFSLGGDSGSLVVSEGDRSPIGLLFAGSDQGGDNGGPITYANPIAEVLAELDVELYRGS